MWRGTRTCFSAGSFTNVRCPWMMFFLIGRTPQWWSVTDGLSQRIQNPTTRSSRRSKLLWRHIRRWTPCGWTACASLSPTVHGGPALLFGDAPQHQHVVPWPPGLRVTFRNLCGSCLCLFCVVFIFLWERRALTFRCSWSTTTSTRMLVVSSSGLC